MAIIGNIYKLENFLKEKGLDVGFEYFKQAIDTDSEIHKRLFSYPVGSFEKNYITDDIFALEQVFYTKDRTECFIESHRKYIDFQLILSGDEQMEYVDIDKLEVDRSYDEIKDLITYKLVDNTSKFLLQNNDLAIFFPDDAHIGLPKFQVSELVYKTVIKLPIKLWTR
jgi:YhcH/YjgK/YiaL family protein